MPVSTFSEKSKLLFLKWYWKHVGDTWLKSQINKLHLEIHSFWRLNPSAKSSTQLNVHLRFECVDLNKPPNQINAKNNKSIFKKPAKYRTRLILYIFTVTLILRGKKCLPSLVRETLNFWEISDVRKSQGWWPGGLLVQYLRRIKLFGWSAQFKFAYRCIAFIKDELTCNEKNAFW